MPQKQIRVLFVEASLDDLQQTLAKLSENGFLVEHQRVDDAEAMKIALLGEQCDVVLCSYNPPAFGGLEALTLKQSLGIEGLCDFQWVNVSRDHQLSVGGINKKLAIM